MARDDAVPFSYFVGKVSPTFRNPFNATFIVGLVATVLGLIYIGSPLAFNAFIGVFAILTTMSYLAAILPHLLSRRRFVKPGPFWMSGLGGYVISGIACGYIVVFNITGIVFQSRQSGISGAHDLDLGHGPNAEVFTIVRAK